MMENTENSVEKEVQSAAQRCQIVLKHSTGFISPESFDKNNCSQRLDGATAMK